MMDKKETGAVQVDEKALDEANGGIGLLLPAVQKVREAAARTSTSSTSFRGGVKVASGDVNGDGAA